MKRGNPPVADVFMYLQGARIIRPVLHMGLGLFSFFLLIQSVARASTFKAIKAQQLWVKLNITSVFSLYRKKYF